MWANSIWNKLKYNPLIQYSIDFKRIVWSASKKFISDDCLLYTSSLTYYCVFSIVPIFAMAFAIAKGFGLDHYLKSFLIEQSGSHNMIMQIVNFSESLLSRTRGGIIAGFGIIILLYSIWSVLNNIESCFNKIWKLTRHRSFIRKITDYATIILFFPIIIILSIGSTIYVETLISNIAALSNFYSHFGKLLFYSLRFLPVLFTICLISSFYIIIPNTRVRFRNALYGGVIAGILFQVFEYLYVHYQMRLTSYNVIYGSFAAVPLLLFWIFYSWVIILLGMEIVIIRTTYQISNCEDFELKLSPYHKKLLSLSILKTIITHFVNTEKNIPVTLASISSKYSLPLKTTEKLISILIRTGYVVQAYNDLNGKGIKFKFLPARDINNMNLGEFMDCLDNFSISDQYSNKISTNTELSSLDKTLKQIEYPQKLQQNNLPIASL